MTMPEDYTKPTGPRKKIIDALKEMPHWNKGKIFSEDHLKKLSESHKGIPKSEETRRKLSEAMKKRIGSKNPCFGTHLSEEHKKKIRDAIKGEKHPQFGKPISDETKIKMSERHLGGYWYGNVRYYDGPQYCQKFNNNLKERVRAFFGGLCLECGKPQGKRKLDVHHVWYNKKACCDDTPRSLVPLCNSCHVKTNVNREYWSDHFQEIVDTYYGGKCWLTKEEFEQYKKLNENNLYYVNKDNSMCCSSGSGACKKK